jgi:hypothetical protein
MKKIGISLGIFILALVLLITIGLYSLSSFITPEFVVKNLESSLNARVNVQKVNINLLSALSSIGVEGIELAPRDKYANEGTELSKRKPISNPLIQLKSIDLGLTFSAILKREFRLDRLIINDPDLTLVLNENGSNNLSGLFKPPLTVEGKPNPSLTPEALEERRKEEAESAANSSDEPFTITSIPISISMGEMGIKNGNIKVVMKKTSQVILLRSLNLILKDLDIVPQDLKNHNVLKTVVNTELSILGANGKESSKFILDSNGSVVPFDAKTGQVNPAIVHSVTFEEGSFISGFAVFDSLAGNMPALKNLNLKLDKLSQKSELKKDVSAKIGYSKGKVTFKDSPVFPTTNYDLTILEGTWIQVTNSTHGMNGKIISTKEESEKAISQIDKTLEAGAKGSDTSTIKKQIFGNLLEGDRVALPFQSTGNIKSPNVSLKVELPSISDLLQAGAKKAVSDAIGKQMKGKVPDAAKDALKKFGF